RAARARRAERGLAAVGGIAVAVVEAAVAAGDRAAASRATPTTMRRRARLVARTAVAVRPDRALAAVARVPIAVGPAAAAHQVLAGAPAAARRCNMRQVTAVVTARAAARGAREIRLAAVGGGLVAVGAPALAHDLALALRAARRQHVRE